MAEKVRSVLLECTTGSSNKFYEVWMEKTFGLDWEVKARYGSRAGNWQQTGGAVVLKHTVQHQAVAERRMEELVRSKRAKGYVPVTVKKKAASAKRKPAKPKKESDPSLERFSDIWDEL